MKLKGAIWGITVDKSKATKTFPSDETVFPKGSRLNKVMKIDTLKNEN